MSHACAMKVLVCAVAMLMTGCRSSNALVLGDTELAAGDATGSPVSVEYDHDGILHMIHSRIDAEQPGMAITDVVAKRMRLSDYYETIDQEDNGMTVDDLMPAVQAQEAKLSDVWVVGFKTQDEIDKMEAWFIKPPLGPALEASPGTIFGADGFAVGVMVFDTLTANCIAANLIPSDWEHARMYDRVVQHAP